MSKIRFDYTITVGSIINIVGVLASAAGFIISMNVAQTKLSDKLVILNAESQKHNQQIDEIQRAVGDIKLKQALMNQNLDIINKKL